MAGRKRAAADDAGTSTRASKAAKTEGGGGGKAKGGKRGPKTSMAVSKFKANALPLHVNVTHTPPVMADADTAPSSSADPGSIGSVTLVPSSFQTGSYGWKGSKRIQIELQNPEAGGEKEKVHVMLTINATVMGSKGAKEEDTKEGKEGENGEAKEEEEAKGDTEEADDE